MAVELGSFKDDGITINNLFIEKTGATNEYRRETIDFNKQQVISINNTINLKFKNFIKYVINFNK